MAKYRNLQTSFWQNNFVLELTPEEKFFYVYLMTNLNTTQCGIYTFNIKLSEFETGYTRETIEKLLSRFIEYGKIKYSRTTREIMIVNWLKYNFINNKPVISCINKELHEVKNKDFVRELYVYCRNMNLPYDLIFNGLEAVCPGPVYHNDTVYIGQGEEEEIEEKEKEEETVEEKEETVEAAEERNEEAIEEIEKEEAAEGNKEKAVEEENKETAEVENEDLIEEPEEVKETEKNEKETEKQTEALEEQIETAEERQIIAIEEQTAEAEEQTAVAAVKITNASKKDIKDVVKIFNNNIHPITPLEYEKLSFWCLLMEGEVVIAAVEEAVKHNVRKMAYIEGVLRSWKDNGFKTLGHIEACMRDFKNRKEKTNGKRSIPNSRAYELIEEGNLCL